MERGSAETTVARSIPVVIRADDAYPVRRVGVSDMPPLEEESPVFHPLEIFPPVQMMIGILRKNEFQIPLAYQQI